MSLSIVTSILVNDGVDAKEGMLDYAATLPNLFVDNAHIYYGDTINMYNVHNLKHILDDLKHFSCSLDGLSCFKFENYLCLKRMVKDAYNQIVQICKPLHELEATEHRHQELVKNKSALSTKARDKCFYFKNGDLGIVQSVTDLDMNAYFINNQYLQSHLREPVTLRGILFIK